MIQPTTCLTFVFVLFSMIAQAQVPDYFSNDPEWRIFNQLDSNYPCLHKTHYVAYINGDSTINTQTYKKVYKRGFTDYDWYGSPTNDPNFTCYGADTFNVLMGLVRQDSMRVYEWNLIYEEEYLLIDFDLNVGDTINDWSLGFSSDWVITSEDSVEINGNYHNSFYANKDGVWDSTIIIEGVGTGAGLMERMKTYFEDDYYLWCYAQDDNSEWQHPSFTFSCNFDVSVDSDEISNFLIYPNPSNDYFNVKYPYNGKVKYTLFGVDGREISSGWLESERIGEELGSGIFFLQLSSNLGTKVQRIIKE